MKFGRSFFIAMIAAAACSLARADDRYKLTDVGGIKVVIFAGTESKDGRYALGWTILPADAKTEPVDWSAWDSDDPSTMGKYETRSDENPGAPYEDVDCVVDLKAKKILRLPANFPDYPHKNRGYFVASWGPEVKGKRHAFVEIDARFYTSDLWMVTLDTSAKTMDSSGMKAVQLVDDLARRVQPVLLDKRPVNYDQYGVVFPVVGTGSKGEAGAVVYHDQTADVPFAADVAKSLDERSRVSGVLTVRLADGDVDKAASETPRDDPFASDPDLKAADAELNQAYAALLRTLSPQGMAALKKEQRNWMDQRNQAAWDAAQNAAQNSGPAAEITSARNKALVESTKARTGELRAALDAARHGGN